MKMKTFEDLIVWQKGHKLVLEIYKLTRQFPKEEQFGLVGQIRRSAVSICANVSEGFRKTNKEFIRYLMISQGSLEETKYHLILAKDLNYCSTAQFGSLLVKFNEIGKMLYGLIKSIDQN